MIWTLFAHYQLKMISESILATKFNKSIYDLFFFLTLRMLLNLALSPFPVTIAIAVKIQLKLANSKTFALLSFHVSCLTIWWNTVYCFVPNQYRPLNMKCISCFHSISSFMINLNQLNLKVLKSSRLLQKFCVLFNFEVNR